MSISSYVYTPQTSLDGFWRITSAPKQASPGVCWQIVRCVTQKQPPTLQNLKRKTVYVFSVPGFHLRSYLFLPAEYLPDQLRLSKKAPTPGI